MANTFVSKYAKKGSAFPEVDLYQQYLDSKNKSSFDTMYHKVIEKYTTPCLIVNEQDDILISNHEGTIEYANQQFQETFGYLTKEVLKRQYKRVLQ